MARSPRRLAPDARREQLVGAALEAFADGSYERVGLEEVAARADVARPLLYRYFPGGKPELFVAVLEEAWRRLVDQVDTGDGRPVTAKLPANVARFVGLAERSDPALRVVQQARHVDEPRVREITRDARRAWARSMAVNHLGTADPPEPVLAVLTGYLAFGEVLLEEWRIHGTITRADVERMLEGALPPLVGLVSAH
jgi:AcrR family transcriptional regulator